MEKQILVHKVIHFFQSFTNVKLSPAKWAQKSFKQKYRQLTLCPDVIKVSLVAGCEAADMLIFKLFLCPQQNWASTHDSQSKGRDRWCQRAISRCLSWQPRNYQLFLAPLTTYHKDLFWDFNVLNPKSIKYFQRHFIC